MRPRATAVVGAAAILLVAAALVEHERRAGPYDLDVVSVGVPVRTSGSYHATTGDASPLPLPCVAACTPQTVVGLHVAGLPAGAYDVVLVGPSDSDLIGRLEPVTGGHALSWRAAEDHTHRVQLVVMLAGAELFSLAIGPSAEPLSLAGATEARWSAEAVGRAHFAEIGGAEVSTVVKAELALAAPEGWSLVAHLEGTNGPVPLGPLERANSGSVLDARVERVPLEDQQRFVVVLHGANASFPVAAAELPR